MERHQLSQLWNEGYVVGTTHLQDEAFNAALEEVRSLQFKPIFREVYDKKGEGDRYRLQASITDLGGAMKGINSAIEEVIQKIDDNWQLKSSSWHALKSLPGGGRQEPHKDFPSFETSKALVTKTAIQASVIVSLMPNARFIVFPRRFGSQVDADDATVLELGSVRFYLFVHAGADFDEENIRMHSIVLVKGIDQLADSTKAVVFATKLCEHCLVVCESRRELANHSHRCRKQVRIQDEKEDNDDKQPVTRYACEICGKRFRVTNTYKHKNREKLKLARLAESKGEAASGSE